MKLTDKSWKCRLVHLETVNFLFYSKPLKNQVILNDVPFFVYCFLMILSTYKVLWPFSIDVDFGFLLTENNTNQ